MEIKDAFIFVSAETVEKSEVPYKYAVRLINREKEEIIAFDNDIGARDKHEYPGSKNTFVYARLESVDDLPDGGFVVSNIVPLDRLNNEKEKAALMKGFEKPEKSASKKPSKLKEIENRKYAGDFLLVGKEERTGQRGKYYDLTLLNRSERIPVKDFSMKAAEIGTDSPVSAILSKSEKYGYSLEAISKTDEFDAADFIRHPPLEEEQMYSDILSRLKALAAKKENSISVIAIDIYEKNRDKLLHWSAAKEMHHNFNGGLLYHTYRMMNMANGILSTYDTVNAELLLSAVALHDVGKLFELETDTMGDSTYTVEGGLLGHALIGIEMIDEAASGKNCDPEEVMLLKHCIAAHHGEYDYGAISKPQIVEAFLLHIIDLTDSRVYMFENEYGKLLPGQRTDKRVFAIDAPVYRPTFTEGVTFQTDYSEE